MFGVSDVVARLDGGTLGDDVRFTGGGYYSEMRTEEGAIHGLMKLNGDFYWPFVCLDKFNIGSRQVVAKCGEVHKEN